MSIESSESRHANGEQLLPQEFFEAFGPQMSTFVGAVRGLPGAVVEDEPFEDLRIIAECPYGRVSVTDGSGQLRIALRRGSPGNPSYDLQATNIRGQQVGRFDPLRPYDFQVRHVGDERRGRITVSGYYEPYDDTMTFLRIDGIEEPTDEGAVAQAHGTVDGLREAVFPTEKSTDPRPPTSQQGDGSGITLVFDD